MIYLAIFLGGGLGSLLRYGTTKVANSMFHNILPIGTIISNILACLLLGIFLVALKNQLKESVFLTNFLVIGLCGGYSTFSTFSNETIVLFQNGDWIYALLNILISLSACLVILYLVLKTR